MTPEPGGGAPAEPLIVTALLDPDSQARFERERQLHFPAHLNIVPAHVTLFHHLPGHQRHAVEQALSARCCVQAVAPFAATGMRFLGKGSAYVLAMPAVSDLRAQLAAAWQDWLTPQDRQSWRPHVTIQNKVSAAAAKQTFQNLSAGFEPWTGSVTGLVLWRYRRHWEHLSSHPFGG